MWSTPNNQYVKLKKQNSMKQLLSIYLNWRFDFVAFLGFVALIMACDETERTILSFLMVKAAAIAMVFATYRLAKYWHARGYFNDIEEFCKEADEL